MLFSRRFSNPQTYSVLLSYVRGDGNIRRFARQSNWRLLARFGRIRFLCKTGMLMTLPILSVENMQVAPLDDAGGSEERNLRQELDVVDDLNRRHLYDEEYKYLQELVSNSQANAQNCDVLWRLARAAFLLARDCKTGRYQRNRYLNEAQVHIQKSLQAQDDNANAHKWFAIIEGCAADGINVPRRLRGALLVKQHIEKALFYQPQDATAHYMMAVWCYYIAMVRPIEAHVARLFFPNFPTSTLEEAAEYFRKAENISPNCASSSDLVTQAKCYMKLGRDDDGLSLLRKAVGRTARTVDDKWAHEEASKMLRAIHKDSP